MLCSAEYISAHEKAVKLANRSNTATITQQLNGNNEQVVECVDAVGVVKSDASGAAEEPCAPPDGEENDDDYGDAMDRLFG